MCNTTILVLEYLSVVTAIHECEHVPLLYEFTLLINGDIACIYSINSDIRVYQYYKAGAAADSTVTYITLASEKLSYNPKPIILQWLIDFDIVLETHNIERFDNASVNDKHFCLAFYDLLDKAEQERFNGVMNKYWIDEIAKLAFPTLAEIKECKPSIDTLDNDHLLILLIMTKSFLNITE